MVGERYTLGSCHGIMKWQFFLDMSEYDLSNRTHQISTIPSVVAILISYVTSIKQGCTSRFTPI